MICRLWSRVRYLVLARAFVEAAAPRSWTDLGAGDGENAIELTSTASLDVRHAVEVYSGAVPPRLHGWRVHDMDLFRWLESVTGAGQSDGASLLDVIEHFDRPVAENLLTRLEQAFRFLVVFTPRGFMPHDGTLYPTLVIQPRQWHRSGFTAEEFERRGYLVMAWPSYHESPDGRTYGAILACRDRDAGPADLRRYRELMLKAYRDAKPSYRYSGARLVARRALYAVAGSTGLHAARKLKRLVQRS